MEVVTPLTGCVESATFVRFTDPLIGAHGMLHALDRRWRLTDAPFDPRGVGQRLLQTAGDGHWLSPTHLEHLREYLRQRRSHYDVLSVDEELPGWARLEWADAVIEHDDVLRKVEG